MAFHVRDPETDAVLRRFASARSVGLTEAIRLAVSEAEAAKAAERERFMAAIRVIQDRVALYPDTGLEADKAFYDSLNDEED